MPLAISQVLRQRYQIQSLLGQGGFGAVYRAWDINVQRWCAVKENLDTTPAAQQQFQREAQMLSRLRHANLPLIHDYFIEPNGQQYLVMELVEGQSLESIVQQRGMLDEQQAVSWVTQILDALDYLHTQQPPIIHRDIKPANILITPQGKAMLVDFGIAKSYVVGQRTTIGARAVTPGYSPPEQYGQTGVITDPRSDIYAIGATLYFLLTGIEPPESVQRMAGAALASPHLLNARVSPLVGTVVLQATQLEPSYRFQSAKSMQTALMTAIAKRRPQPQVPPTIVAPRTSVAPTYTPTLPKQRNSGTSCLVQAVILFVLGLFVLGVIAAGGIFLFSSMNSPMAISTPTAFIRMTTPTRVSPIATVRPISIPTVIVPTVIIPTLPTVRPTPHPMTNASSIVEIGYLPRFEYPDH